MGEGEEEESETREMRQIVGSRSNGSSAFPLYILSWSSGRSGGT
jgi:hypothetical protein